MNRRIFSDPLRLTAAVVFFQFFVIVLVSFLRHQPVYFIAPGPYLGWDYSAFYASAQAWAHGADPYSVLRYPNGPPALVTPPASLLAGFLFVALPFTAARVCFLVLNIVVIAWALVRLAWYLQLSKHQTYLLLAITAAYYPFYSVIERGNVDGLVLAGLVLAQTAKGRTTRAASLAAAIAVKIYPGLLVLAFARRRTLRAITLVLLFSILFALPFAPYLSSFMSSMFRRTDRFQFNENFSPASIFWYSGLPGWAISFFVLWLVSLAVMLYRDKDRGHTNLFRYTPWMLSFPQLVLSHSGILFLPLLAMLAARPFTKVEKYLLAGFLLTAVQAVPLALMTQPYSLVPQVLYLCAPIGTTLILISTTAGALETTPEPALN